ncbi:hypothetical protein GCM10027596_29900 [Nocardioides korecus]
MDGPADGVLDPLLDPLGEDDRGAVVVVGPAPEQPDTSGPVNPRASSPRRDRSTAPG